MKKLYFIRHGLSELNAKGLIAGTTETPLTKDGRDQAKLAGVLAKEYKINKIISSPQGRALETAQIIAKQIGYPLEDIITNKLVMERDYGPLEGTKWSPDLNLDGISDIETDDILIERAKLALKWLDSMPEENILVVSHGSFGRALRSVIKDEYPMGHSEKLQNAQIHRWV